MESKNESGPDTSTTAITSQNESPPTAKNQTRGLRQNQRVKTPPRLRTMIRHDRINPADYMKYNLAFSCEDCVHFSLTRQQCSKGYEARWHRREVQEKSYALSGTMALCRFIEIS